MTAWRAGIGGQLLQEEHGPKAFPWPPHQRPAQVPPRGTVVSVAPVAQGIEHFSPKEGVVRSNRIRGTLKVQK